MNAGSTAPKVVSKIKDDLRGVISYLIERGLADDQNNTFIRRLGTKKWEISFQGAEHVSLALGSEEYETIYKEMATRRSFNIKLLDGGLLQLQYLFEMDRLVEHRLAYLPSPSLRAFKEVPEEYLFDELFVDIIKRHLVPFPLRFDFDKKTAIDVEHPACHLTLGDIRGCRIPVSAPLTPRWFTEFILRNFYQTEKYDLVGALPSHRTRFSDTLTDNESRLIHIKVPILQCGSIIG